MWAASSRAWMAETSTTSLVRTSSRNASPLPAGAVDLKLLIRRPASLLRRRRLLQIGDQLHLPPPPGHRIEHETRDDREKGQQHEPGGQDCRRNARDDAFLEVGYEDRDRQHDRNGRQRDAEREEEA